MGHSNDTPRGAIRPLKMIPRYLKPFQILAVVGDDFSQYLYVEVSLLIRSFSFVHSQWIFVQSWILVVERKRLLQSSIPIFDNINHHRLGRVTQLSSCQPQWNSIVIQEIIVPQPLVWLQRELLESILEGTVGLLV